MRFLPPLPLGGGREEAFFAHSHIHRFTHPCVLISSVISKHKPHYENVPFEIPESWEWTQIKEISSSILYGVSESAKSKGRYKLLRITDIQDNKVNWDTVPYTDFDDKKATAYILQNNDILFARTGATVGKSYLVQNLSVLSIYASYLIRIQVSKEILSQYIKYYFESGYYWEQISASSLGIGQPNVNGTLLGGLNLPLPPLAEQQRIVAEVEKWFALIDELEVNKEDLKEYIKQVKSKVLDLAIHGKLVPQDPNDEPAIELLKRINPNFKPCDTSHYENLPHGWEATSLANVIYLLDNKRKPIKAEERAKRIEGKDVLYPYYGATGFVGYIDEYLIEGKFLLLGEDGAPFLDKHADKAYSVEGKVWVNNHAHILLPRIDFDYLKIYLNAFNYHGIAKGTTRLKLTQGDMNSILVAVPPLAEQQRISNLVEQIFTIINSISAEL